MMTFKLQIRGPFTRNANGTIDCEFFHPDPSLGWVPFTANMNDPAPHGRAIYDYIVTHHASEVENS